MSVSSVNQPAAVAAAIVVTFTAVAAFLVLPVFMGAAAESMELTGRQIGFLASGVMTGSALSSIVAVTWVRRVDWVRAASASLGLLLVAQLAAMLANDFMLFMLCQCVAGLGGGAAYSLALTALSDNDHPDRCFGLSIAAQVLFQMLGMMGLPAIVAHYGLDGVLLLFIALAALGLLCLRWFPRAGIETVHVPLGDALFKPRVLAALAGCFFFFFNVGALWTYIERMAVAASFSIEFIGMGLAAGVAMGIPGALLASWCSDRFGRILPLAIGALGIVISLALLRSGMSEMDFLVALAMYNFCWNFSLAFQYAAVNAADHSGRSVAAAPAFHGAGGAVGPGVAALFVSTGAYDAVNVLAAAAVLVSFTFFLLSARGLVRA